MIVEGIEMEEEEIEDRAVMGKKAGRGAG